MTSTQTRTAEAVTCPVIYATVDDETVLALAVGLHDQKCRSARACPSRRMHALDCFGEYARNTLTILASTQWPAEI
ncbi:hypothetical protein [Arthrobacter caoxuetaonis]|uniref:Uncharacterized protein n=1 Tax=Arthrobacter caoxuetaonis TaxID=2886935 RepID=A0A9X1MGS0_9MICC|nr:hypothetical protein [Arthrobacter caoxuetaonis]MCC3299768.1 hypothetical protein [Arthrobacter caoxuetaonis]USQ59331.1 hypothetical protein NF551_17255 [Arthrobacter caoxuetaonis]